KEPEINTVFNGTAWANMIVQRCKDKGLHFTKTINYEAMTYSFKNLDGRPTKNETMNENKTTTLYEHYKNTPKKLKIVCDWDEVIQAYINDGKGVQFSPYGSQLKGFYKELTEKQQEIKNSPDFYRKAPFLTIAEDLLKLIKEDKVEKLIFLSAYDKRKFPNADYRKVNIFVKTFFKLVTSAKYEFRLELIHFDSEIRSSERTSIVGDQTQGQSKAD
ncbi:10268_t:CDS:2, partial [Ambispora leptoticha]